MTEALERKPAESAGPGDIIAIAGIPEIMIGETLADPENPIPLPLITVDEPAISMTIGTNTCPMVGRVRGSKVTARMVKDRLDQELVGNVSLRVLPTERPDTWEVQGRGELALAILVEQMRREGYELTVGKPQVVTREVDGKLHEPVERLTIDTPEEYLGADHPAPGRPQGPHGADDQPRHRLGPDGVPRAVARPDRLPHRVPHRDPRHRHRPPRLRGLRAVVRPITTRTSGSLVSDRTGVVTAYAMVNLQERGTLFVDPTTEVYEGMIVGENSRADDMDVNITKEKKLTNVRASSSDNFEKIVPPRKLSLEQSLEFCREDECVEVTPEAVRIRKVELDQTVRARSAARARNA